MKNQKSGSARKNFALAITPFAMVGVILGGLAAVSDLSVPIVFGFFALYLIGGLPAVILLALADQKERAEHRLSGS